MACERCGGFKVHDYFYGATDYFAWQCFGLRCVNCGAITKIHPIESNPSSSRRETARSRSSRARHSAILR